MSEVSLKELLEAGCHFGHQVRRWNPKTRPYLYMARGGLHIFDLVKTRDGLEEAMKFLEELVKNGGQVVFVGTKRQASGMVKEWAERVGMPYVTNRWLGGLLTNHEQVGKSIKKLTDLKQKRTLGKFEKYTKKEQLLIDREINKLEKFLGGLVKMDGIPDAIFVVDTHREQAAVREANKMGVKVVGMVDSNADPDLVDIAIPVNDDAVNSIQLVVRKIAEAVERGLKKRKAQPSNVGEDKSAKKVEEEKADKK